MANAFLTVSEQLDDGENNWAWKQEGCVLGWAENRSACRMPTQQSQVESDGERAVGEDNAENSWQNGLAINDYCAFLCIWGLLRSRVKVGA